ncbi:MAG: hypothetical protein WD871_15395 [Xanthobacteraceae bacterium]
MTKRSFSRGMLIAAVSAAAIGLAASGAIAAGEKKDAKMAAKPAGPGLCTANMNSMHWGWLNYRTAGGNVLPTAMWCPEASCPAKC